MTFDFGHLFLNLPLEHCSPLGLAKKSVEGGLCWSLLFNCQKTLETISKLYACVGLPETLQFLYKTAFPKSTWYIIQVPRMEVRREQRNGVSGMFVCGKKQVRMYSTYLIFCALVSFKHTVLVQMVKMAFSSASLAADAAADRSSQAFS